MCLKKNNSKKILRKALLSCCIVGLIFNSNASDMSAIIAGPGNSLSFNIPIKGYMNDINDFFSFVKSRSSSQDNNDGYGILHYAHGRALVNSEDMWYLNNKKAYLTDGESSWQDPFYNAKDELILTGSDNISSIVMAAACNQGGTLKSHPARFNYKGKTYSLILNGSSGSYPGPTVNRSYEYSFFRDAELDDGEGGTYNWFRKYPSLWSDVDPYTDDTSFTFSDFPTGEITLNVIMYYMITENIDLEAALKRALTDTHFGNGFEHTYGDSTYKSLDLKAHITDSNYAFTAIISDGEKVYAFKSWAENDKNKDYCQNFQIGYIQRNDFTAVTSIGEHGNYSDFKDNGLKLLGQYDLAIFDPNKLFDPLTDIRHNFLDVLPIGTIGDTSAPSEATPIPVVKQEITIGNPNVNLAWNKSTNVSSIYSEEYSGDNLVDTLSATAWASKAGERNQWAYVKVGSDTENYIINDVKIKWSGKYFAKRFRIYGHRGGDVANLGTWKALGDEVINYNTVDGVYTLSGIGDTYQYVGVWLSDLNDVAFAIKEFEVYGHSEIIEFPDEELQYKILMALGKKELPILKEELLNIKTLVVDGAPIKIWQGINECENLERLSAQFCGLESFPNLSTMENLKIIDVSFNKLTTLANFNSAPNLEVLSARMNEIRDIKPSELSSLVKLKKLDISENELQNLDDVYYGINGIEDLISLESINFSGNPHLTNISILNSLQNLKLIFGANCGVSNTPVLSSLYKLTNLDLSGNNMSVPPNLTDNVNLVYLNMNLNSIEVIDNFIDHNNVNLKYVYLIGNGFKSLSSLEDAPNLRALDLRVNYLEDITPLINKSTINFLNLEFNNLDFTAGLGNIETVNTLRDNGAIVYH